MKEFRIQDSEFRGSSRRPAVKGWQLVVVAPRSFPGFALFRVGVAALLTRNLAVWFGVATSFLLFSCNEPHKQKPVIIDSKKLKEEIVQKNIPPVIMEQDEINAWIKSHGYPMKSTGTGLRYYIFKENPKGKPVKMKSEIKIKYKVSLLDGTECYSSDKKGPRTFLVGADNIETGLHEGVQLMREGEKAIFILPAHLAFGLVGDRDKIPPKSTVEYEIEILRVN